MRPIVLIACILLPLAALHAQTPQTDSAHHEKLLRKSSFIPIPIVYYTPETRWAGGIAALYAFRTRGQAEEARPSQITLGFAYTQEQQLLLYLPFQLFSKDETWQANGELGYYRYVYQFFGNGNETRKESEESYDVNYPRLRLNLLRLVAPHHYLGLRYWWDDYRITGIEQGGILDLGGITGSKGGVVSGTGLVWNFDSRDQIFYPTKGYWAEAEAFINGKALGSDFNFARLSLDAVGYFSNNKKHVVAVNAWLVFTQGEVPFQQLAFIGGPKKMRGYFEGRHRDKNLWTLQAEYRAVLKGRFGAVVFGGAGAVSPDAERLFRQKTHFTYGAGLRFMLSKKDHINLRLDVAANEDGEVLPYLTVREAF
ncbi:MAG: BamA/TamA family outer membrane protein [Bacteroidetes bacterium]|nr:BamA/TamA family outer membrane protein [Bacteroidota bacterium]